MNEPEGGDVRAGLDARSPLEMLFFDVGGVCLTNGWDRHARAAAAEHFALDIEPLNERHYRVADAFERGELPLDAYLDSVIFHRKRDFGRGDFVAYMRACTKPHLEALAVVAALARSGRYRMAALNNESRELNEYRIARFGLRRWFGAFFSSCYLGARKPEARIYRIALDVSGVDPSRCLFVDDRAGNVEGALAAGLPAVHVPGPAELGDRLSSAGVRFDTRPTPVEEVHPAPGPPHESRANRMHR